MSIFDLRRASNRFPVFAVAAFLIVPGAVRAQVPSVGATTVKQAVKLDEIATLKSAKKLLEEANHDYKGHRAKAVHAIHEAIVELEHHKGVKHLPTTPAVAAAKANVRAAHANAAKVAPVHEAQVASDVQVKAAQQLLLRAQAELSTGKHPKASAHVLVAIQELEIALKIL
jgi:hypothetical protein